MDLLCPYAKENTHLLSFKALTFILKINHLHGTSHYFLLYFTKLRGIGDAHLCITCLSYLLSLQFSLDGCVEREGSNSSILIRKIVLRLAGTLWPLKSSVLIPEGSGQMLNNIKCLWIQERHSLCLKNLMFRKQSRFPEQRHISRFLTQECIEKRGIRKNIFVLVVRKFCFLSFILYNFQNYIYAWIRSRNKAITPIALLLTVSLSLSLCLFLSLSPSLFYSFYIFTLQSLLNKICFI